MWKDNNIMSRNKGTFEKVSLGTLDNPNIGVLSHKYSLVPADFVPSSVALDRTSWSIKSVCNRFL